MSSDSSSSQCGTPMSCWLCAITLALLSTSTTPFTPTNPWLVCLEHFYSFLAQIPSSLLHLWIPLELDTPFPEILQVNLYFMTACISLSLVSRCLWILAPCHFLSLVSFFHLRAFVLSFLFTWTLYHVVTLFVSLLRYIVGQVFSDFPILYRNSCHFFPLPPLFFFMLLFAFRCVYYYVVVVHLPHWIVSNMQACLSDLFTLPWPVPRREPAT